MKYLIILLMLGCTKEQERCYECTSPQMPQVTFCWTTEGEMDKVIEWRMKNMNDTLICKEIKP